MCDSTPFALSLCKKICYKITVTMYKRDKSWQTVSKQHASAPFCRPGDHNGVWSPLPSCGAYKGLSIPREEDLFCRDRQILDAHSHRVIDGIGYGWGYRGNGIFADRFALKRALAAWRLYQHGDQGGDVLHGRDLCLPQT